MKLPVAKLTKRLVLGAAGGLVLAHACGVGLPSAAAQQKSPIQLELEKLYQQDGRDMPDMRMESLPRSTPDGRVFENAPAPLPQQQQTQPAKKSLLDRLLFFRKPKMQPGQRPVMREAQPSPTETQILQQRQQELFGGQPAQQQPQPNYQRPTQPAYQPTQPAYQPPAPAAQPNFQRPAQPAPNLQRLQPRQPQAGQLPGPKPFPFDADSEPVQPTNTPQPRLLNGGQRVQPAPAARPMPMIIPDGNSGTLPQITPQGDQPQQPVLPQDRPFVPPVEPVEEDFPETPLPLESAPETSAAPMPEEFFPDPFTDVSETEADSTKDMNEIPELKMEELPIPSSDVEETGKAPMLPLPDEDAADAEQPAADQPIAAEPADEPADAEMPAEDGAAAESIDNPFSGLTLEPAEEVAAPATPEQPAATTPPALEETGEQPQLPRLELDPAFDEEFQLPMKKAEEAQPELPQLDEVPAAEESQLPTFEQGDISWEEEEARRQAKLRLIAEREGESGLKGFCIVALRDHRDLADALPAFRSTFNLRTYHFSSLEAKIEFDKSPEKFVPAYDGNDAILLSTQSEEREGSLDFALWYKGRLYLFSSQENMSVFQKDPGLYAAH